MIIKKVKNEIESNKFAEKLVTTTIEVDACDCEIEALCNAVGKDVNICPMCGEGCDETVALREPAFGGAFYDYDNNLIYIEKVIYNKPAVIVVWSDGTKTRSTCDKEDIWNPELGLMLCVMKKVMGQDFTSKLYRDWAIQIDSSDIVNNESTAKTITLKDVRRNLKENNEATKFVKAIEGK